MSRSLEGVGVVVTRAERQARPLVSALRESGAAAIELPLLEITPPPDGGRALVEAVAGLRTDDWLVVLSPNGARSVLRAGADSRRCRLAVLAGGTASVFDEISWTPELVPATASSEGLLAEFPQPSEGTRVLIAQAVHGRPNLADGLRHMGWHVEVVHAYDNALPALDDRAVSDARDADVVVFASPSAVDRYVEHVGLTPGTAVCIGEVTAATAADAGFTVSVAEQPTVDALLDAISRNIF